GVAVGVPAGLGLMVGAGGGFFSPPPFCSFFLVIRSVAPGTGETLTSEGPAMTTRLLISGKVCVLMPVLKSIRVAVRTFAIPPASPLRLTRTTPRSVPPSWVKFVILSTRPSGTVIVGGEDVMILLLNPPAKTRPAFTRKKATKHRLRYILIVICAAALRQIRIDRRHVNGGH